tara:strand:- start:583 stop:837 length:255 start_codon:yes stop_codon:yes gene_type:complete
MKVNKILSITALVIAILVVGGISQMHQQIYYQKQQINELIDTNKIQKEHIDDLEMEKVEFLYWVDEMNDKEELNIFDENGYEKN